MGLSLNRDEEVVAVPVKKNFLKGMGSKDSAARPTTQSNHKPSYTFAGVFPPPLREVTERALSKKSASRFSNRSNRRKSAKSIVLIDSDSEDSLSDQNRSMKSTSKGTDDDSDFLNDSSAETSSSFEEEMEPSEDDEERVQLSEEESDRSTSKVCKKAPAIPRTVIPKRNQKRKAIETDDEKEEGVAQGPPQKKAKIVKEKKARATTDPWRLNTQEVQKNWSKMHAPPLDMFHFHRLVIDEFTYTKKEHVSHAIVTRLSANCRWVMSGTPPTGDFASVKGIATFLGIHLGVDDDAEGSTEEVKSRIQNKTAAEAFHSFREVRTPYWHASRHEIAQRFLNRFVRQVRAAICLTTPR